jgi:hypothetical protein
MTRVLLTRPHTHAGLACAPGEHLDVDAATAAWLLAHNVAAPDPKPAKLDPAPKPHPVEKPKP